MCVVYEIGWNPGPFWSWCCEILHVFSFEYLKHSSSESPLVFVCFFINAPVVIMYFISAFFFKFTLQFNLLWPFYQRNAKIVKCSDKANGANVFLVWEERANEITSTAYPFSVHLLKLLSLLSENGIPFKNWVWSPRWVAMEPTCSLQGEIIGFQRKWSLFVSNFLLFRIESFLNCELPIRMQFSCE